MLVSRAGERGPKELVTDEACEELEEAIKKGQIATIAQAHRLLSARGIEYAHPESVAQLLKRRQVKLKSGRPRHRKADPEEQQRFKKSSPRTSEEKASSISSTSP